MVNKNPNHGEDGRTHPGKRVEFSGRNGQGAPCERDEGGLASSSERALASMLRHSSHIHRSNALGGAFLFV